LITDQGFLFVGANSQEQLTQYPPILYFIDMSDSRILHELHRRVFELTLALYRVTDFFPQGEVLKRQLREKANEIFGGITEYGVFATNQELVRIGARIQTLKGYLEVARSMRFVRPINLAVLDREYDTLIRLLEECATEKHKRSRAEIKRTSVSHEVSAPVHGRHRESEKLSTWRDFSKTNNEADVAKRDEMSHQKSGGGVAGLHMSGSVNERQKAILEHLQQTPHAKISDLYGFFSDISSKTIQRDLQDLVNKNMLKKVGEKRWTRYSLNTVL
jgi:hypothetical protein